MSEPFISVVIPVRNAEDLIGRCLLSVNSLDYPREKLEILVADGMSTDHTVEVARTHGANVVSNPGIRVVSARNCGFKAAHGELVAFSDADCVMEKGWLRNCVKYFEDKRVAGIGGPNLVPDDDSTFAKATGIIFDMAFALGGGAPTKRYSRVFESRSHGSNAIFRAAALRNVMPVDETVREGEDVVMNTALERLGYKLLYVPDVVVYHYRRTTPRKWWRQMCTYGMAKIVMARKMKGTVTPVQTILGMSIPIIALGTTFLALIGIQIALVVITSTVLAGTFFSISLALVKTRSLRIAVNMPLAVAILPVAWSWGFLGELVRNKKRGNEGQT